MQALLKGAPQRLYVLDYGLFQVHASGRIIGICGYLIQTNAGENVLIDTGFPAKYGADSDAATLEDGLQDFGRVIDLTADNLAPAQLARIGLSPADITLMIQSHTHIDHVGYLEDFAHLPIVIADAERALPRPLYWAGKQPLDWPDTRYHLVTEDCAIGPGFDILLCPGHAPGQLAFRIELRHTGSVLLTSDAISRPGEIAEQFAGSWDVDQAQHHGARLMQIASDRDAFVIYGHCPAQWETLRKAPQAYE
ncbi:MAG: MBL fold metallo-hydrolase [Roseobacter sp.]